MTRVETEILLSVDISDAATLNVFPGTRTSVIKIVLLRHEKC